MGMIAGLGIIIPGVLSCNTKEVPGVGKGLSTVTLNDLMGNKVVIPEDFTGKIAVIHFWASWCPTCRGEMMILDAIGRKYRDKGVITYSIGIGEKKETAMAYIENLHITYPVLLDPGSITQKRFGIAGIPTYFILDRGGVIRYKILGAANKDGLDKMIEALL
jgi:cytochrome c biogenesis protein CcmG, thiol:disulfide interchange protein DsbE